MCSDLIAMNVNMTRTYLFIDMDLWDQIRFNATNLGGDGILLGPEDVSVTLLSDFEGSRTINTVIVKKFY